MNERERLLKLIADNNMSAKQFAAEVGIQAGTISNIVNGRNNPSLDVMQRVLNRFRTLSSDWLILGVGNMYRTEGGKENRENGEAKEMQLQLQQQEIPGIGDTIASPQQHSIESPSPLSRAQAISAPAISREMQPLASTKKQQTAPMEQPAAKRIERVIVFYSDGTFDEITAK